MGADRDSMHVVSRSFSRLISYPSFIHTTPQDVTRLEAIPPRHQRREHSNGQRTCGCGCQRHLRLFCCLLRTFCRSSRRRGCSSPSFALRGRLLDLRYILPPVWSVLFSFLLASVLILSSRSVFDFTLSLHRTYAVRDHGFTRFLRSLSATISLYALMP